MPSLRVRTPAKINLFLRVVARRPDGYHDLETVFQAVELSDEIIVHTAKGDSSLDIPDHRYLENENNLVIKALRWVESRTGHRLGVAITLRKNIPVAAGLGGGSSNAAGTLIALRTLFGLDLSDRELLRGAAELGADVPFFLVGGTAVGEGTGDRLTQIALDLDYELLLVNPGFPVSTKLIFDQFDANLTTHRREVTVWRRLQDSRNAVDLLANDLQSVAETSYPEIAEVRKRLETVEATRVLMTGSGPTVFGLFTSETCPVEKILADMPDRWFVRKTRPVAHGVIVD